MSSRTHKGAASFYRGVLALIAAAVGLCLAGLIAIPAAASLPHADVSYDSVVYVYDGDTNHAYPPAVDATQFEWQRLAQSPRNGISATLFGDTARDSLDVVAPQSTPVFRGPSQLAPGGQAGPAVSLKQVKQCLGQCGMSVSDYNIVHKPVIDSPFGPAFGQTRVINGKPVIEVSDVGLSSMDEAVATIFHEINHVNSLRAFGHTGTEAAAESFGQRMLD